MPFIVYEQDPLVVIDLTEMLSDAFGEPTRAVSRLDELLELEEIGDVDLVVIISVNGPADGSAIENVMRHLKTYPIVVIANSRMPALNDHPQNVFVSRPFNSVSIQNAVKSLLSDRRSFRP